MATRTGQSAAAEEESLKLVEDLVAELTHALNLLGGRTPDTLLNKYRFWSCKHLHRVAGGFALLRRSAYVDSSKLLIRPAIEMRIRLKAAAKEPGLFYRIAYSEHLEDKKLLRAADRLLNDGAQSQQRWEMFEANWHRFRAAFATEYPAVDQIEEKLSMACAAQEVGQEKLYEGHYRTYSGYTHGTLRASMGYFDDLTDPQDNGIMAACASTALDALVPLGAELPNREDLLRRVPYYE